VTSKYTPLPKALLLFLHAGEIYAAKERIEYHPLHQPILPRLITSNTIGGHLLRHVGSIFWVNPRIACWLTYFGGISAGYSVGCYT
jgi:hypothetical protein